MLYSPNYLLAKRLVIGGIRRPVDGVRLSSELADGLLRQVTVSDSTGFSHWIKRSQGLLSSLVSFLYRRFIWIIVFILPNRCQVFVGGRWRFAHRGNGRAISFRL